MGYGNTEMYLTLGDRCADVLKQVNDCFAQ